eukprot:321359-Pleurochrysis_carterae.AAC.4
MFMLGTDDIPTTTAICSASTIPPTSYPRGRATTATSTTPPTIHLEAADLFGIIPRPANAHAAWTDDCCDEAAWTNDCCDETNMCTDPTVLKEIALRTLRWASQSCKTSARFPLLLARPSCSS